MAKNISGTRKFEHAYNLYEADYCRKKCCTKVKTQRNVYEIQL